MNSTIGFWRDDYSPQETSTDKNQETTTATKIRTNVYRPSLSWPPGKAGRIAEVIYQCSPRPVAEISIVAAIALLAGVCGRAWTISRTGLNLYIVLLARSGVGKEAMQEGIAMFIKAAELKRQNASAFFDFNDYASGQALTKAVVSKPCFLHIAGEFGRKLKRMSSRNDTALQDLRTVMTKLYSKSGPNSIAGGITYSDKEKNVGSISGVSFSMLGESTPGTFREALTDDMMEDGFLSRFNIVEYDGERPAENRNQIHSIPDDCAEWFVNLLSQAHNLFLCGNHIEVRHSEMAKSMLDEFSLECDRNINESGEDNTRRQMWNRAHIKVLRVAALLAVADNDISPCITTEQAVWAIDLIRLDIGIFNSKIESGDIGDDDKAREIKLLGMMKEYLMDEPAMGYKVPIGMQSKGIIQRKYLQRRTSSLPAFKSYKLGATTALDHALRSLCNSGFVRKADKQKMVETYKEHGECYYILNADPTR